MQRLLSLKSSSPAAILTGLLSNSELEDQIKEEQAVTIEIDYSNSQDIISAVRLLKAANKSNPIVNQFPEPATKSTVYQVEPATYGLSFTVNKQPTVKINLLLKDIVTLINEFNKHTKYVKKNFEDKAKNMSFLKAYFYLRKANKIAYDQELILAKATANLMQKVEEKLTKEINAPKITIQPEDIEISLNYVRSGIKKFKNFVAQNIPLYIKNKISGILESMKETESNTYKSWIAYITVMIFNFVPLIYSSLYFAAESMESLSPYLFFISPHLMAALGVICTINILAGTICFMAPKIMNYFKLHFSDTTPSLHIIYKQQLEAIKSIDNQLLCHNNLPSKIYEKYLKFSQKISKIPSQHIEESSLSTILTWLLTGLTAVESFSNSIMTTATILGMIVGAFTYTTVTPPLLIAFVTSHLASIFFISIPIAMSNCVVSFVWRVSSTSVLFDPEKDERDAVETMRCEYYNNEQPTKHQTLNDALDKKKQHEQIVRQSQPIERVPLERISLCPTTMSIITENQALQPNIVRL